MTIYCTCSWHLPALLRCGCCALPHQPMLQNKGSLCHCHNHVHGRFACCRYVLIWGIAAVKHITHMYNSQLFHNTQEYFVEDMCETLAWTSRARPQLLDTHTGADFMTFVTVFPGQPEYIKNPYLRYKLIEGLQQWLPEEDRNSNSFQRRRGYGTHNLAHLFQGDPLVGAQLVPTLLQLYTAIQHIDRAGQFYEKFRMRHTISDLLGGLFMCLLLFFCITQSVHQSSLHAEYLFKLPEHHAAWAGVANADGGRGLYLVFCDMLVNDTIFLLDDAITRLPKVPDDGGCTGIVYQSHNPLQNTMYRFEQQSRSWQMQQRGEHWTAPVSRKWNRSFQQTVCVCTVYMCT